ncbi:MAG: class III extradiol ring-cleavage dioxygenase [Nannocystaceae bacterium]
MKRSQQPGGIGRREFTGSLAAAAVVAAVEPGCAAPDGAAATPAASPASSTMPDGSATMTSDTSATRMPAVFLPHGGGPWPFVKLPFGDDREQGALADYLRSLAAVGPRRPSAILMISAHWEAPVPTLLSAPRPPTLHDYYGFPPESYTIQWPAPGDPALAERVQGLLAAAGIASELDPARGFDHGTFVPLALAYPGADVPTIQLSLIRGLDPAAHLALGRALAPLRDEGVLIVGSGMTYHNLRAFNARGIPAAATFDAWLQRAIAAPRAERERELVAWSRAPAAREAHPREEHLLPLMVVAGAAGDDAATVPYHDTLLGLRLSAFHFG